MTSVLLKVPIMTQLDIKFCILLFYTFLRNIMAFDKELAILYGFFSLRISKKKLPFNKKAPMGPKPFFFFNFVQNCQILSFK